MAIEKNLIQVQTDLQSPNIQDKDLIKYANGENPQVPSFLALMEMSRRKQIEEGAQSYDASNQKTIKDQLTSALTAPTQLQGGLGGLPAGQVNPTMAPAGIDMGAAPQGINMGAAPPQANPTLPSAQPKTGPFPAITGAHGGLMSLPVNHFNANSYAGGGIVAFAGGGGAWEEAPDNGMRVLKEEAQPAPVQAPAAGSYQGILAGLPQVQPTTMPAPEELSREQVYENIKQNQRLAGVSEDPYAEVKKRESALEARQQKAYEQGGLDRLLTQLSAFAKADPAKGFGYAGAVSAEASQVLEREQQALRDKQESAQIEFHKGLAKEEDGKKRGDATAIQSGLDTQRKAQEDYAKLQQAQQKLGIDQQTIAANIFHTQESAATQREATKENAAYHKAMLGKPTREEFLASLAKTDPETFRLMQGQGKAGVLTLEEALKIVNADKVGSIGKTEEQKLEMAQRYLDAQDRLRKSGTTANPNAPAAAADDRPWYEGIFGSSKPAANTIPKGWTVETNP